MSDLKKAFNAARVYWEHTTKEAASELGISETFLHKFLNGDGVSAPLEKKIKGYVYQAGIIKSINKLGLDPEEPAKNLQPTEA